MLYITRIEIIIDGHKLSCIISLVFLLSTVSFNKLDICFWKTEILGFVFILVTLFSFLGCGFISWFHLYLVFKLYNRLLYSNLVSSLFCPEVCVSRIVLCCILRYANISTQLHHSMLEIAPRQHPCILSVAKKSLFWLLVTVLVKLIVFVCEMTVSSRCYIHRVTSDHH